MKHEYKQGDDVWYKGEGCKVVSVEWEREHEYTYYVLRSGNDIYRPATDDSDLSPYPPVKAVDGWAVVSDVSIIQYDTIREDEDSVMEHVASHWESNGVLPPGYRCIPVTITAKKD